MGVHRQAAERRTDWPSGTGMNVSYDSGSGGPGGSPGWRQEKQSAVGARDAA